METVYYYLFKTIFNSSAIFVALDTNSKETKEFLGFYIDKYILVLLAVILIITLYNIKQLYFSNFSKVKFNKIKIFSLFVILISFLKFSGLIIYNLPYKVLRSTVEYYTESKKLGDYVNNKTGNFTNVFRHFDVEEKEVYVIVIGESTARSHLGIYDYYRETTPLLEEIEDELLVYKKVISPDTYTIASLTKALTLGNYENPEGKYKGSIIQLLNKAKFKTYWISNQKPIGLNDSHVTKIGLGTEKAFFLNIKHSSEKTIFDDVLVEKLNSVLQERGNKKVIFLHTLGTHFNYKNRYPEDFDFFNNVIPKSKFKEEKIYAQINAYDNAVRYADYIVRSVIESTKKNNATSFVLYFSDHGEEVYDDIRFSGHFRDKIKTKNVYEIPMLLWCSESFKERENIHFNLDSKYMIDDMFHSIADLLSINAKEVDSTRSIFSEYFKERKRIVRDTIDYDTFFNLN
ncbi:hypothetical protein BFR04_11060 [Gaetbulibacter sp. 4G1]|nr:hypothetical protein BFR04_11060 [Gaetbulibacter sp. 4G1]